MFLSKAQRFFGPGNEHVILTPIILGCLMRIPKTFRETFQLAKLVLVSTDHDCLKVLNAYGSQASLFEKYTMQKILLKQTDSEIHFDAV